MVHLLLIQLSSQSQLLSQSQLSRFQLLSPSQLSRFQLPSQSPRLMRTRRRTSQSLAQPLLLRRH